MDPGWDHTENEDKLLLDHTSRMGRDMAKDMYGTEVRSLSSSGCYRDGNVTRGGHGSISLNGEYNRHISTISGNILNANQNSLSTLSIDYISYFYKYYSHLLKTFPNLFSKSFITQIDNLMKYINCSLIRFKCYIRYFISCISPSLTSSISNIKSLTALIPQFEELIKRVLCNLKSAIGLNITLLCLHITKIGCLIKCFNKQNIDPCFKIISCINMLICVSKTQVIQCFKSCLSQIKLSLYTLRSSLISLFDTLNPLKMYLNSSFSKACPIDSSSLKPKLCELTKRYKCSISEINKIQSCIKSIQCVINKLKEKKQELCKQFEKILLLICISSERKSIKIVIINGKGVKNKLECLTQNIDKICSEFEKIDDNTTDLEHSLLFNSYYLEISSYILNELECIQSSAESIKSKTGDLKQLEFRISVISGNVNYVKSMIEKVYERRDDLEYVRDSLCSIMPKLSEVKESAIKIKQLQCVVNGLYKIKSSIEKLKPIEYDQKCLEIFDLSQLPKFTYSLRCIRDNLNINCITSKLSEVENGISSLEIVICSINKLLIYIESIENISSVIEYLKRNISKLANKFLRCSIESLSNQLIISNSTDSCTSNMRVAGEQNHVMSMYSVMNVMDYRVVVNRLLHCSKKIDQMLQLIPWPDGCQCILGLESTTNKIDLVTLNVQKIIEEMTKEKGNNNNDLKLEEIKKLIQNDTKDNHLCLCMIVKYILYPKIIITSHMILGMDLVMLSTLDRKFQKYTEKIGLNVNISRFLIIMINLLDKICIFMERRYLWATSKVKIIPGLICFCRAPKDKYYLYYINTILLLSSLIENIWSMDTESMRSATETLSILISEFDMIDSHTNNRSFISMNLFKLSFVSALSSSTQSCKMLPKLRIIADLVSLSNKVPYLDWLIKPYISKISLCNIFNFENVLNNLVSNINNNNGPKKYIEWVLKLYKSVGSECKSCNKSNCCCNICVNLMVLWVSIYIWLKVNIKLHESNTRYKERLEILLKRICNCGDDCCCKDLQTVCDELCCKGCAGCVCKTLQDSCKEIFKPCNGGNDGNCLSKKITETISKFCNKGTCQCCKNKEGCCRCPPCKVLGESLKILTRACRANVLEPYKRIVVELISCDKNKEDVIRTIVEGINRTTLNNIYLVKNSYSSYPYSIGSYQPTINSVTNVETRNWGYDTRYEHDVGTDKGFSNQYPYVSNRDRSGSLIGVRSNKAFKMILSRMLVGGVIVFVFIYIRLTIVFF